MMSLVGVFEALERDDVTDKYFVKPDAVFGVVSFFVFQSCASLVIGRLHWKTNKDRRHVRESNNAWELREKNTPVYWHTVSHHMIVSICCVPTHSIPIMK